MSFKTIEIPPIDGQPPQGLIVLLHGWGANANDLVPLASALNASYCHFVFPEAPFPHPYAHEGRMWYDLENQNFNQLQESCQRLTEWLDSLAETVGVPCDRTLLGGFSQGGAMALHVGLARPLAGLISLSGYLHPIEEALLQPEKASSVFIAHGRQDPIVPLQAAQKAKQQLNDRGILVEYHEFEMAHEIRSEVLVPLQEFISAALNL